MASSKGQNALVFGTTNVSGGRILLTSSGKLQAETNTTTSAAGPNSSIDINKPNSTDKIEIAEEITQNTRDKEIFGIYDPEKNNFNLPINRRSHFDRKVF